jgi:phage terminase small subunit
VPTTKRQQIDNDGRHRSARALTARQTKFVMHFVENGGRASQAAIAAGYSDNGAGSAAQTLLRKPHIYQELMRALPNAIGLAAVPAVAVVTRLMSSAKSDYVKLEAARDLLDRAGFQPPQRVDHRLDSTLSVSINLGPSKTPVTDTVTHPDTRNFPQEDFSPPLALDLSPSDWTKGDFPSGIEAPSPIFPDGSDDASGD